MHEEIFADGIGEITLEHGVFRIDLVTISPTKRGKDKKPTLEFRQRIIMPPDGFLRSFASMERVVKKLVETGAIKRGESQKDDQEISTQKITPPSFSGPSGFPVGS